METDRKHSLNHFENTQTAFEDDFSNYMKKVDMVEDLIKRLGSKDQRVSGLAMKDADQLLKGKNENFDESKVKIKNDRTVVNQKGFDHFDETAENGPATMQPHEFMKQVEEDSKKRAEDRRMRKIESDKYKNEGNKAFRNQKYAKALVSYDKAIECLRDSSILYCNRSLTYLKLGLPEKALKDAEMSLAANEKSLRGYVYKGQSLWQMGRQNESRATIEKACNVLPAKKDYLQGILEEWKTALEEGTS